MQTVNPKELRIGNYITSKTWRGYHIVLGIRETISKQVVTVKGYDHIIEDGVFSDLTPILLTEEILLKCGFEKIPNSEWQFRSRISALNVYCRFNMDRCYFEIGGIYFGEIESLHRLQNIWHSIGQIELTFNL